MANYRDMGIADVSFIAGVDFSTSQYQFVTPGSVAGEVTLGTGASGPAPIGIIQNNPSAGQEARVRILGFSKLVCEINSTCTLLWGRWLTCGSGGHGEPLTAVACPAMARYMEAGAGSAVTSGSILAQVLLLGFTGCSGSTT